MFPVLTAWFRLRAHPNDDGLFAFPLGFPINALAKWPRSIESCLPPPPRRFCAVMGSPMAVSASFTFFSIWRTQANLREHKRTQANIFSFILRQKSPNGEASVMMENRLPLLGEEGRAFAAPEWLRPRRRGEGECLIPLSVSGLSLFQVESFLSFFILMIWGFNLRACRL